MTAFHLNAEALAAINQETRSCFLLEDAPNYLTALSHGLELLQQGNSILGSGMLQALHSLKGGAGIAQLLALSRFTHKLEDLLEVLGDRAFPPSLIPLLGQCIDEIAGVLAEAKALPTHILIDVPISKGLEETLNAVVVELSEQPNSPSNPIDPIAPVSSTINSTVSPLVKSALTKDLEQCLLRAEQELRAAPSNRKILEGLLEECTLLGEALDLPWLLAAIAPIADRSYDPNQNWSNLGSEVINQVRSQRQQYLNNLVRDSDRDSISNSTSDLEPQTQSPVFQAISHLRIPTSRMDQIASTVGELLVRYERLNLNHQHLARTNQNLRQLIRELNPIQDQVQELYDQLAIAAPTSNQLTNSEEEFDALELDRYSSAHGTIQNLQEFLLRMREARADIDVSQRELGEEIIQLRGELDHLYSNVTKSRLVPFKRLAERFLPQLQRLCQQYHKSVNMRIEGEEVLVDQVILEQLQTPINHLLVNAFDHGIESDRAALDKNPTAEIKLKAAVIDNQVEITLSDDGCGIDLTKIYQKAIALNLCQVPMSQLSRSEILDLMFMAGFSTATEVSMLSGRGMGLDIVRSQINHLRGTIRVDTIAGQGTTFTLRLPLGLSLLPLLICGLGDRSVAFPSTAVLDIFLTAEAEMATAPDHIQWRDQSIPLFRLRQLLAFAEEVEFGETMGETMERVILVLHGQTSSFAVKVDAVIEEKPLILKPFDQAIAIPSYLAGCTILGTGKVVPVVLPQELSLVRTVHKLSALPKVMTPTIMIAEDSIATRSLLERIIKQLGYKVIGCRDGQEAWETLQSQKSADAVQLIISDIEMPRLNGFGLLQSIRSDAQLYAMPVIMLTSRSSDRHRQKALSLGASAYLTKPFNTNAVLQHLQQFLN